MMDATNAAEKGVSSAESGGRMRLPFYPLNDGWGLSSLSTGQPFFVNTRDRTITPWIIMSGRWETNVDDVICAYTRPGMTCVDVGAHMGYFTVKLGTLVGPTGRLFAFEPNPDVAVVCAENIKINGLSAIVTMWQAAVGAAPAMATLTYEKGNMASANLLGDQAAEAVFTVEVGTIDNALPKNTIVDVMKLDAEGYESMIFEGAAETLSRSQNCAVMLELNLGRWTRHRPIADLPMLIGGEKDIFAVSEEGRLIRMTIESVSGFLATKPYTENYFFFIPKIEALQSPIRHLIE